MLWVLKGQAPIMPLPIKHLQILTDHWVQLLNLIKKFYSEPMWQKAIVCQIFLS